jgi:hypothetical protein
MLNYGLHRILYKIIILTMKYLILCDNFVMVLEFDKCMCSLVNLMNIGALLINLCFVDNLCTLIDLNIKIKYNCV